MSGSMDSTWEIIHENRGWGAYPTEHVIRFVARNYYNTDRNSVRILDFGCGQGAHTWYLSKEGFDTYAFDGSESAVRKCIERLKKEGVFANCIVADATELPYESDFFDAIIDNVCIYANRMQDIRNMYSKCLDLLKPGGKLLTVCFGDRLSGYQSGEEVEPGSFKNIKEGVLVERGLSHIFSEEELIHILQETGFVNISCEWSEYSDNKNIVHHYICKAEKSRS